LQKSLDLSCLLRIKFVYLDYNKKKKGYDKN